MEAATRGAVDLRGATAQISSFGAAATRELANVARDTNKAEKAGEAMVRQIERQIEVFGKSATEIRDMRAEMRAADADSKGLTELATRLRTANDEIKRLEEGNKRLPGPTNAARAATQNLGFQIQDFAVQVVGGTSVMRAFAMQAPQAAGALTGFEGKLGTVGKFLNGPWGIAITLGMTLLAGFADKIFGASNSIDDHVDKLKKQAAETEATRQAQQRFKSSAEGVAAAIRDSVAAQGEWLKSLDTAAERANIAAKKNLALEISHRRVIMAELEHAKVVAEQNANNALSGDVYDVVAKRVSDARLAALQVQLKEQEALIKAAEREVNFSRIDLAAEAAARAVDPVKKINAAYDDQIEAAKRAAHARAAAGQTISASLTQELIGIERNRQAALKAEEDRQAALKQTQNQIGRTINLMEAREIAEKAGGRVTSDLRSHEKQQELYDKYVAYKNGTGPWAALAAKPGTSNHELGQALDVAKTDGMTLKKLVAAYRAAGVKLTEALDEGSHFHIAWAAGKAVTEAAKEAEKVAKWMEDQRLQLGADVGALSRAIEQRNLGWDDKAFTDFNGTFGDQDKEARNRVTDQRERWRKDNEDAIAATIAGFDLVQRRADSAADAMAHAFGRVGTAIGDAAAILVEFGNRQEVIDQQANLGMITQAEKRKASFENQLSGMIALTGAAKGLFKRAQQGLSGHGGGGEGFRHRPTHQHGQERGGWRCEDVRVSGAVRVPSRRGDARRHGLPRFRRWGSAGSLPASNTGTGTVLGDASAKSESIKRSIDALKEVDTVMLTYSRQMAASLQSIDSQIGNLASLVVRTGNINASQGITTGFAQNTTGKVLEGLITGGGVLSKIPIVGGIIGAVGSIVGSLFGTKTSVIGSGLYGGAQSLQDILAGGFDASYYSDIKKKKKFFGITSSTKYSTQYSNADAGLENQFTLILRQFNDAVLAAAGPLGEATDLIQARLNHFVVNIGKIDLQGLTGDEIEEKLVAVFGAAADDMAKAAFPGIERFQTVGEGLFETLVRVASTVEKRHGLSGLARFVRDLHVHRSQKWRWRTSSAASATSAARSMIISRPITLRKSRRRPRPRSSPPCSTVWASPCRRRWRRSARWWRRRT